MAKSSAAERAAKPNLLSRRERTRKAGKCQLCETKVAIDQQYTVVNDLDSGKPVARKNAGKKGQETASHYCSDCKDKRVAQKQAWLDSRDSEPKAKKTVKKTAAKKSSKAKAKTTGKAKTTAKKKTAKKTTTRKAKASAGESF